MPLRTAWAHEANHFTPWLAEKENLDLLAEKLGIPLQLEAKEKQVGTFFADILAKEPDTDRWVLIENQITPTDHSHLGQLLTYAAGLDARTIVWIAEEFREEHRAAIDFLNRATLEDFAFFGVQVELYRIGESPLAADFTVVAKPNDWTKRTQSARQASANEDTESQLAWKEYWQPLMDQIGSKYPQAAGRAAYRGNWQTFETIKGGNPSFSLNATFAWDKGLRVEVYIDKSQAKWAFAYLKNRAKEIEAAFGQKLDWEELPERQASRIAFYMPGNQKRAENNQWQAQHAWITTWAPKLADALRPFIAKMTA